MKIKNILAVLGILAVFALSSCNKGGCPNKLDVEQPEVEVVE